MIKHYSPAVDNYIFGKPEEVKLTLEILRDIIFETVKGVEESVKWNCPFYCKDGLLCYINYERKTKKVTLGLIEGTSIIDKYKLFSTDTAHIKKIYFDSAEEIPIAKVKYYLREAVAINKVKTKNFMSIRK
jgi:hypothetical protein